MKNFLFDLYGTLADVHTDESDPAFIKRYAEYFKRIAPDTDFWQRYAEECEKIKSDDEYSEPDLFEVFKAVAPNVSEDKLKKAAYVFRKYSRSRLRLYKGAKKLLLGLKARGAKIYLVSNAQACLTVPELKKLRLPKLFDGIELSSDFGKKKPCKDFFLHAIQKYGLDVKQSIYCGNDFHADVEGAKSAHLATAYINSNISPAEDNLEEIKKISDFATSDYGSFINYLLKITGENYE